MPRRSIRAHYEQLSKFERGSIIELKEGGCANRRITGHMGRSDVAIRRYWQKWVDNGRFQRHDGSSRPMATEDLSDQLSQLLIHCYKPSNVRPAHECPP
ncbi:uncharacterized protein TNCV_3391051 [Trichonephila clavipes]|nr:uncharacterized protein TNCV_3391051 [Trichonephila clavipes]